MKNSYRKRIEEALGENARSQLVREFQRKKGERIMRLDFFSLTDNTNSLFRGCRLLLVFAPQLLPAVIYSCLKNGFLCMSTKEENRCKNI